MGTNYVCIMPDGTKHSLGDDPSGSARHNCQVMGGHVSEEISSCSTTSAARSIPALSVTEAELEEIRDIRNQLGISSLLQDLAIINYAPEFARMTESESGVRDQIGDVLGVASRFALLSQTETGVEELAKYRYDEDLHRKVSKLADAVRERSKDTSLHEAIARLLSALEQQVGTPIDTVLERMKTGSL
jgi:predicted transcriptional regulator